MEFGNDAVNSAHTGHVQRGQGINVQVMYSVSMEEVTVLKDVFKER